MSTLKRTPLFDVYAKYGGKTIDFGGWELPVQFAGIKEEHETVRTRAGLFDVSHMGEISVKGKDSLEFIQKVSTNDASKLSVGKAQYSVLCYENGGTVDDILVYKRGEEHYWLVVNAANIEKDFEWLNSLKEGFDVVLENESSRISQLALQGPMSQTVLEKITEDAGLDEIAFFHFREGVKVAGAEALISRTGYTGEDGFEIYCSNEDSIRIWEAILKQDQVEPIGLGARDTLRFEAGLALYGQELSADITPIEAGIGFAVKTDKAADFLGKEALKEQKEKGAPRKLVGIEMVERGIPRHGYPVYADGELAGHVTSGTQSPTLKKNVGYALVRKEYSAIGQTLEVGIRSKKVQAKVVASPFYKKTNKK